MKKLLLLSLLCLPAGANAWEYWMIVEGAQVSRESIPPVDLTYPPPGAAAPVRLPGDDSLLAVPISEAQLQSALEEPHLVIVPSRAALSTGRGQRN